MPYSYNGWYAAENLPIQDLFIRDVEIVPGVSTNDDVWTILHYIAKRWDEEVEPLVKGWCWGYNFRPTTNANSLSCHASATAIDLNAPLHPYGVAATKNLTMGQIAIIHDIIDDLPVVWGGDYRYSVDAMHIEIMGSRDAVHAAAERIRNMEDEMKEADFERILKIVQNNTIDPDQVRKIVREEIDAQFDEQTTVKTPTGTRTITWRTLWKETWQKLNKHV